MYGFTPAHEAAFNNAVEVLQWLHNNSISVVEPDKVSASPGSTLHNAIAVVSALV